MNKFERSESKCEKCEFGLASVKFLGHIISLLGPYYYKK